MQELIRKHGGWLSNWLFFGLCVLAGIDVRLGLAACGGLLAVLFFAWLLQADGTSLALTALSLCIFMGILHKPFFSTRLVYHIQEGLVLMTLAAALFSRPGVRPTGVIWVPLAVFGILMVPNTLLDFPLVSALNSLRNWLVPLAMFFLAHRIYQEGMETVVLKFLLAAVIIQVPASFLVAFVQSGKLLVVRHPDFFSGTFGGGGTTVIAVLVIPLTLWGLWAGYNGLLKKGLPLAALTAMGILLGISGIKFALVITPGLVVALVVLEVVAQKNFAGIVAQVFLLIIPVFLLVSIVAVGDRFITIKRGNEFNKGGSEFEIGLNIFNLRYLDKYLGLKNQGIALRSAGEERHAVLTRYGMVLASVKQASRSARTLTLGHGLDSGTGNAIQESLLKKIYRVDRLTHQAMPLLLFETGLIGLAAYLLPVVYYVGLAFFSFSKLSIRAMQLPAAGVFAVGLSALVSIFYSDTLRGLPLGGTFWFLCGMMQAQRDHWHQNTERHQ